MLIEERMTLDFIGAFHSGSTRRIAVQKAGENGASFGTEFFSKAKGVIQYFFIHLIGDLFLTQLTISNGNILIHLPS